MAPPIKQLTYEQYTVGWVCALPKEMVAARAMLDEEHLPLPKPANDSNTYTFGRVGNHNVVIACLPMGEIGNSSSAIVATRMTSTFPFIKFGLMVGIGGGVPKGVRLGDVVVSTPAEGFGGVVQWDFGKTEQGRVFKRTGALNSPPSVLRTALAQLKAMHEMEGPRIPNLLEDMAKKWPKLKHKYVQSSELEDILFKADYNHVEVETSDEDEEDEDEEETGCIHCDRTRTIRRKPRNMRVHYGLIASGNQVIKDASFRDEINKRLGGKVLCFEMEAAGLMNDFPCIVVRGICDYADSHKNKAWQEHAAAVAAAMAKELLLVVPAQEVSELPAVASKFSR
ncbi:purine and uridine phosphorylase [Aspergillus caelatus]|uniref:Purine and uridine phosphorylase n=1 Tax=Aspergillus caelatus TaxID=61420 RepID=A0A5N7AJS9_9EURO|nr:purine and uridine phosphorylase [Aspergillus caelatus]KAE8370164.1 purine and uridine phosphorylase [Aspergillus caelatus]